MIPVVVDISSIAEEFYLTRDEMNEFSKFVIEVIASKFKRQWEEEAKQKLHQTRNEFIRSIYVENMNDTTKVVGIKGFIPNAVEQGVEAFDLKPWFEKSKKVSLKKGGGWYLTIPFRFGTPDTIGDSQVFSNQLPDEIHEVLLGKNKAGDDSGLKLNEIPEQFRAPKVREKIVLKSRVFEEYEYKSPIYEGIIKSPMQYHSQYSSFRRVSDLSDENSWIHTGIQARNLSESALQNLDIETIAERAIDNFLGNK